MSYVDKEFEKRRATLLQNTSNPTPDKAGVTSKSPSVSSPGFVDSSFEQRRSQILSAPTPTPAPKVSATPSPTYKMPSFVQAQAPGASILSGLGTLKTETQPKIKGIFIPSNGPSIEIKDTASTKAPSFELTPEQLKSVGTLKVGQTIPGFESPTSASSATIKKDGKLTPGNVIDEIFTKPANYLMGDSGYFATGIKKVASDLYNNPVEFLSPLTKEMVKDPVFKAKLESSPGYKVETQTLQGIMQGALRVYANFVPGVQTFLDKEIQKYDKKSGPEIPGHSLGNKSDSEIIGNTVGNIIGTIGSFVLGGEVAAALKFGKIALPLTFATLGQTSLPSNTPAEARLRNAVIDTVSGTLLEYVKPLANLQKVGMVGRTVEYTKQLAKSMGIMSAQTYLDARSVGASDEQAKEMVKDSVLILLGLHGFMVVGKAGSYATRSKFKEGSGIFTPEQAKSAVIGTNLEKTKVGQTILKYSLEAESMGKNLKIDMTAAKKSATAKFLDLKTPNGIAVTDITFVDPIQQPKLGTANVPTEKTTAVSTKVELPKPIPKENALVNLDRAIAEYRMDQGVNISPTGEVRQTATLQELTKLSNYPDVISKTQEEVAKLPTDQNGDITLYRVGTVRDGDVRLISASYDKKAAETFKQNFAEAFGKDRPITEIKVKPEDIKIFMGGDEKEVLVEKVKPIESPVEIQIRKQAGISDSMRRNALDGKLEEKRLDKLENIKEADANSPRSYLKFATGETTPRFYRAGVGPIEPGDFVTLSKANAEKYVKQRPGTELQIKNIALKDLVFGARKNEFIYAPKQSKPETKPIVKTKASLPSPTKKTTPPTINQVPGGQNKPATANGGVVSKQKITKALPKGDYGFNPKDLKNPFSKEAKVQTDKIVKQSEIAKTLSDKLGVPIRRGKFRSLGAIGVYKHEPKVVRIKAGGLQTIFHEVAHYLDDTIGFSGKMDAKEIENLVQEYGNPPKDPARRSAEAFAEYMRFKMTGQTEKIAQWAPQFDKAFDEKIKTMPDIKDVLDVATADFKRWNEQPAVSKVLSHISIGGTAKGPLKDRASKWLHNLYTAALDDLHPLSEFSKLAEKNLGPVAVEDNPYILARNLRGWVGKAELFLNKGTFGKKFWSEENGKTKMNFTGKSFSEIMSPIEKSGSLDDFRVYMVSQRIVNDLADRKIVSGISTEDAKKAYEQLKKSHPEFEDASREIIDYQNRLLDFAKDNGLVGVKGLKQMRELNKYHVPFYRVMEESGAKFLGKTKVAGNISSPIKKIKGSEREIIDPLESIVKDTYAIINAAERNNIGVAMARIAQKNFELGRLFERVVAPMKATKVNVKEVLEKALKGTDAAEIPLPEELANTAVTLFRPTYASGPNMLNVNMGDKQLVYEVDPDLFKSIQGLNLEDVGTIMKILSLPAKTLRAGATLSPDFSVRNPLRDQFTAFVYSKYGFTPGVDLVKGMFELFRKGDVYNLWKAGGGEHAMFVSIDREKLQENLKDVMRGDRNFKDTIIALTKDPLPMLKEAGLNVAKNPLKLLQMFSELGEAGTRLGEMRNALNKGVNPIEAAYASRNITLDFSRIGTTTRAINAIIPFTNANIQASDMMVRKFKEKPFQTLWKALLGLTLPSILLYLANREDPRWKEIPQWQKNMFWIILTPNHIWRIPKPFELGSLFGSIPERVLEVMDTKDPELFNEMGKTIADGFTPGWMPAFMIPVVENLANYSFFFDRPIVSRGQENLPPSQQYGPYTTEVSKILGEALNTSPAKIDNLISGYTGGIGKYATQGIDGILKGTGIVHEPVEPTKTLEEMPIIKAFMVKEPIGSGSESVNKVYNQYNDTLQKMNYAKKLVKEGKGQEAITYVKENPDTLNNVILTLTVNSFSDINKAINEIKASDKLTADEKKEKITKAQRIQTEIAQKVLKQLKENKK